MKSMHKNNDSWPLTGLRIDRLGVWRLRIARLRINRLHWPGRRRRCLRHGLRNGNACRGQKE